MKVEKKSINNIKLGTLENLGTFPRNSFLHSRGYIENGNVCRIANAF